MDVRIRDVRPTDAEALTRIWNEIIRTGAYSALDTPLTLDEESKYLDGLPPRGFCCVAEEAQTQRVPGFQNVEPFASYTHAFDHVGVIGTCVDLALRRSGIGTRLAHVSFNKARNKGYEKLFTYVRADNEGARSFYRKLGFHVVGTARKHAKLKGAYVDSIYIEVLL